MTRSGSAAVIALLGVLVASALGSSESARPAAVSVAGPVGAVIERHRAAIPELMAEEGIPGLAVALVDRERPLWVEGFGHLGDDDPRPVTGQTPFGVQSMSKVFTATAVMVAVEQGRVDLDEPITTYLPQFTVHSAFETYPERRITLRMLLSHTAGFTHEALVGNNYDLEPGTFEGHVRSISDTWLRFPVGSGYSYSNLGIDLAAHVLEEVYGVPFPALMRELVLGPVGMGDSTFDRGEVRALSDRAVGHLRPLPRVPVEVPMTAAGGLYATADDLGRFLRFQLGDGTIDGRIVLAQDRLREQRTIPPPEAEASAGYALGVAKTRWRAVRNVDLFSHGGGGFGFLSDLWWAPDVGLGIAVLTNSGDHHLQGDLAVTIMREVALVPGAVYAERVDAVPSRPGPVEPAAEFRPPAGYPALLARAGRSTDDGDLLRWVGYAGAYKPIAWGVVMPTGPVGRFVVRDRAAWFEVTMDGALAVHRLVELEPGLFLSDDGEVLDLRGVTPTWGGIELVRAAESPAPGQWLLVAVAGLAAVSWPPAVLVRWLRRRSGPAMPRARGRAQRAVTGLAILVAAAVVGQGALLVAVPGAVDSGFLGWLDVSAEQRAAWHLPAVLLALTAMGVVATATAWSRGWWSRVVRVHLSVVVGSAAILVLQLAAWRLIGWSLG